MAKNIMYANQVVKVSQFSTHLKSIILYHTMKELAAQYYRN